MTDQEMRELGYKVIDFIVDHKTRIKSKKTFKMGTYDELNAQIDSAIPTKGEEAAKVFHDLHRLIDENINHTDHPRFFSFIPGPSNYYSVLAETMATGFNVFSGHWMSGSIAGMIEKRTIEWLTQMFGYPEQSGGIFLSGGSMANMTALVAARDHKLSGDFSKGTVYYSEQTHSSVSKALRILGFQPHNMRKVGQTKDFKLNLKELTFLLKADIQQGLTPFCIIGNAGTTNTGAIDELEKLAEIAEEFQTWLHIDAAYGGATILSNEHKSALSGIHLADSITLDPHKWWFQPFETGCLIVKDRSTLRKSFSVQAEYLDTTILDEKEINYYNYGPQLTRSFRALKLYTYFRIVGLDKIGEHVTQGIEHAEYIEDLIAGHDHWELISKASIGIISFRANPKLMDRDLDELNSALSQHLLEDGFAMITTTKLKGHIALRMCPIHPDTTKEDILQTFDIMNVFVRTYAKEKTGFHLKADK
ncbi:MAG: aminotransferase class I/II-fold pyridoxal phosphate-dependent enzyme [Bacteroidota bacterium]